MSITEPGLWQWLALLQHELLLFAGVFFLIGALDDLAVDGLWLWLKATGRALTPRRRRAALQARVLHGQMAVIIPAWREAAVIGQTIRPAAYAVTEFPPLTLPLGAQLEAYGQAGWVGGPQPTAFADGQASLTREIDPVGVLTDNALRLSLGAGVWGGAQEDAQRVDLGPTVRLDLRIGSVPARLSVDWRQQVAGDASPGSGVAATLSTGF